MHDLSPIKNNLSSCYEIKINHHISAFDQYVLILLQIYLDFCSFRRLEAKMFLRVFVKFVCLFLGLLRKQSFRLLGTSLYCTLGERLHKERL